MAWASHLHRDFANHCPKSPSFYLRFSQLPLSGEGCQLGPHRPLRMAGNPTCCALSLCSWWITNQYGIFPTEPTSSICILLNTAVYPWQPPPVSHGQLRRSLISTSEMVDLLPSAWDMLNRLRWIHMRKVFINISTPNLTNFLFFPTETKHSVRGNVVW